MDEQTFAVTLVRSGSGLPSFEVGAYRYTGQWLPSVGEVITVTKPASAWSGERDELHVYVSRVDPMSETPIRAIEAPGSTVSPQDDGIIAA